MAWLVNPDFCLLRFALFSGLLSQQQGVDAVGVHDSFTGRPAEDRKPAILGSYQGVGIPLVVDKLGR